MSNASNQEANRIAFGPAERPVDYRPSNGSGAATQMVECRGRQDGTPTHKRTIEDT